MTIMENLINVAAIKKAAIITPRIKSISERTLGTRICISAEWSRIYTEGWQEADGCPLPVRHAKALKNFFAHTSIAIRDGELIVGSDTMSIRGVHPPVPVAAEDIKSQISKARVTTSGTKKIALITDNIRKKLLEDCAYWDGKSLGDQAAAALQEKFGERPFDMDEARVYTCGPWYEMARGPSGVDHEMVLQEGFLGIISRIKKARQALTFTNVDDYEKDITYQAWTIVLEGMIRFAHRYAELAWFLVNREKNKERKEELECIAKACEWVPANPPRNFHEALQSFWFTLLGVHLEAGSARSEAMGRFDQFMYPFYEKDVLQRQVLTRDQAVELLACLWLKVNECDNFKSMPTQQSAQSSRTMQMTIAGQTFDGKDAVNELTWLILQLVGQLKLPVPLIALRYHNGLSEEFLMEIIETKKLHGGGQPAILSDNGIIPRLVNRGVPLNDARDYGVIGCVNIYIPGRSTISTYMGYIYIGRIFELTLNNGWDHVTNKQLGIKTGDIRKFKTYDELWNAFKKQTAYCISTFFKEANLIAQVKTKMYPLVYLSPLIRDCIENGKDVRDGGLRYPQLLTIVFMNGGHQNVADSLAAIKKLVFDEKKITMDELINALEADFEGYEDIRHACLNAPKYGNDDDDVDIILRDIFRFTGELVHKEKDPLGFTPLLMRQGITVHYYVGAKMKATPDGRKAGEALADGSVSPMGGMDKKGPTAVLNSIAKLDEDSQLGTLLNMKLSPNLVASNEGKSKFLALMKTYMDCKVSHDFKVNMVSRETLLDAKAHPEKHRDLVVRIAGYNAYFVELGDEIKDEIIRRTWIEI